MKELNKLLPPAETIPGEGEYIDPADGLIHCIKCGQPRQMYLQNDAGVTGPVRIPCSCEQEQRKAQDAVEHERMKQARIETLRANGIPSGLYRSYTFDNDQGTVPEIQYARAYADHFSQAEASSAGLLFWGGAGTGKTYLAGCIANALIDWEIPVQMTSIPRIANRMNGLFSEDRNRYLEELNRPRLLIIDDLGAERSTDFSLEQVYMVIDSRYASGKPMILTTNLSLEELEHPQDRIHARIYSRILERCAPIRVNGRNLRMENAAKQFLEMKNLLGAESAGNQYH